MQLTVGRQAWFSNEMQRFKLFLSILFTFRDPRRIL